ncbi:MAG: methyltransferase domain-containing protein [Sulfurisoma sp.]|nr:methyltransferase domain-containing protein [Sulfurisoma sp.]
MRQDFARAAASYDEAAVLARETGRRMAERLDLVKIAPKRIVDIGCATGDGIRELQRRYPRALPLAIDYALPMLDAVRRQAPLLQHLRGRAPRPVNADVRALPLASGSLDLAWSNLMLHWLDEPQTAFAELHRVLDVGGLLMFSMLGPDTLKELRVATKKVMRSGIHGDGGSGTARRFLDMHDIGDMLVHAGFADPVMDMEMMTLTYRRPRDFLADQRHLGVRDGLLGARGWREWRRVFGAWQPVDGLLPASFEIVHGHAWKAAPRTAPDGRAIVRFATG